MPRGEKIRRPTEEQALGRIARAEKQREREARRAEEAAERKREYEERRQQRGRK